MNPGFLSGLVEAASTDYRRAGRFAWHFARGKLAGDPIFSSLLERGLIADGARVLDLGCGQGLLAAWLFAARGRYEAGQWPEGWPPPPRLSAYRGIELMAPDARRARLALGERAEIVVGDIRAADLGEPDTAVILDVLQFIGHQDQEELLARLHGALSPAGTLLLRVGAAEGGAGFALGVCLDYLVALVRGHGLARFHCRALSDWENLPRRLGFSVECLPMGQGTPFANFLLIARKNPPAAAPAESAGARETQTPGECASR